MEGTNDHAVDVDSDSASDNINMEQSIQPTEQSKKIKLTDLPKEILEYILIHLDYKNLLNASHVCKLFASYAETAFALKNVNEFYETSRGMNRFDVIMLNKYGEKMQNIRIDDDRLMDLIKERCTNLIGLMGMTPRMPMIGNLKKVELDAPENLNRETFIEFIRNNQQLESLTINFAEIGFVAALDGQLNKLKDLSLTFVEEEFGETDLPKIRLKSLETLTIQFDTEDSSEFYVPILLAMNCNAIKTLHFYDSTLNEGDEIIDEICKFKSLVSLCLPHYRLTSDQIRKLANHLPDLVAIDIKPVERKPIPENIIHSMPEMFPKLNKISIALGRGGLDRLFNQLQTCTNDFHARFAKNNIEIIINNPNSFEGGEVSITKDRLIMGRLDFVELHWMENLNVRNVRKSVAEAIKINSWRLRKVKFVNNCAGRAFDISTLENLQNRDNRLECLEFKSNGPMSVNTNTLRYHILFPWLKILKIHLVQHTANDFLQNLDPIFCEQIEELWLNTRDVFDGPDMMNIRDKFKNLKSLHLSKAT